MATASSLLLPHHLRISKGYAIIVWSDMNLADERGRTAQI
jgi:hypothetical protein